MKPRRHRRWWWRVEEDGRTAFVLARTPLAALRAIGLDCPHAVACANELEVAGACWDIAFAAAVAVVGGTLITGYPDALVCCAVEPPADLIMSDGTLVDIKTWADR